MVTIEQNKNMPCTKLANQLVTATTPDGKVTKYAYDAAGRMVKEGAKSYRYGYLDKVLSVKEGKTRITYGYHVDGQLATVTKGRVTENFIWDGLALVKRGTTSYVNEPHPGGGAPVASSNGGVMFNDILGTTLGVENAGGYASSTMTAFGDTINCQLPTTTFFTGKPHVDGLGHAFLLRNYRADLGKWPTADPLGYPDGWNQMAYGVNSPLEGFDYLGGAWNDGDFVSYYYTSYREFGDIFDTDCMGLTNEIWYVICDVVMPRVKSQIEAMVVNHVRESDESSGKGNFTYSTYRSYDEFYQVRFSLGGGTVGTSNTVTFFWTDYVFENVTYRRYDWSSETRVHYSDLFADPLDIGLESPGGAAYSYYHDWYGITFGNIDLIKIRDSNVEE